MYSNSLQRCNKYIQKHTAFCEEYQILGTYTIAKGHRNCHFVTVKYSSLKRIQKGHA